MAVYVDNVQIAWRGTTWNHLVADSLDELHQFAANLGLRRSWFQEKASYPHYDVTAAMRYKALSLGAIAADRATIIAAAKSLKAELMEPPL